MTHGGHSGMEIIRLPAFNDNYIFLLVDRATGDCAVVDPGDAKVVLEYLSKEDLTLKTILITHHHADHVGGNRQLLSHFPAAAVYGSEIDLQKRRIPGQTVSLKAGNHLDLFNRTVEILFVHRPYPRSHRLLFPSPTARRQWRFILWRYAVCQWLWSSFGRNACSTFCLAPTNLWFAGQHEYLVCPWVHPEKY